MSPASPGALSAQELQRYHRHLILPGIGEEGQQRLKAARVLLIGAGGLGSPAALYLAAAGIGNLGIVDADVVELSNLQRQVLHGVRDVGRAKVASAADRLRELNPDIVVTSLHARVTSANALELLGPYDIIVDGSDNFPTRYLVNDACVLLSKPNVHGSVIRFDGQVSIFSSDNAPCYRCLFPAPPAPGSVPDCAEGGVFGVLPGLIGVIQATETIKLITGVGDTLAGKLLLVDAAPHALPIDRGSARPECRACGTREITQLVDYEAFCGMPTASRTEVSDDPVEETDPSEIEITPKRLPR